MNIKTFVKRHKSHWVLAALIILASSVWWNSTAVTHAANTNWNASYWNNKTLSGTPVLQQQENDLNHDWGDGTPNTLVNKDQFSARWTRTLNVSAGSYRFTATMDDGMRVWFDNVLIIDSWWDSQVHSLSADIYVSAGDHQLKVEYYEAGGDAVAKLNWTPIGGTAPIPIGDWKGDYFNNITLSGSPVLTRDDTQINFDWGTGSPLWGTVAADQFSARWTRNVTLNPGKYRFTAVADDGIRVWANSILIIDQWHDANGATYTADIDLPGGSIPVQVEYYENQGGAKANLSWIQVNSGTWKGEYFNNATLSGNPVLTRDDTQINFDWGSGSPATGINADNFSARWTRSLAFNAGTYRFSVFADDGVRLWVNGQQIINAWSDHTPQTFSSDITLSGSTIPIQLEYYEHGGGAKIQLSWSLVSSTPAPTPVPSSGSGTVVSALLNVRTGPGINYTILGQLTHGQVVPLVGYRSADANWVMITWNNTQAWVSGKSAYLQANINISSLPVWNDGQTTPSPTTTTGKATVTNAAYLNMRSGPGVNNPVITVLTYGVTADMLGRNATTTWVKLQLTDGRIGWVNLSYMTPTIPFSSLPISN
ncbi:MAG: SH3 domain-containing protein [Ardenticatenaceae bacterium]|nr:SH3 domain-containing protein [Ardenticatenaceae bacterium]